MVLHLWENYHPPEPHEAAVFQSAQPREVLSQSLVDAALRNGELSSASLKSFLPSMGTSPSNLCVCYTEEASGNAHIVARREAALSAYLVAFEPLEVAAWSEAEAFSESIDADELHARRQAGRALTVVYALAHTCRATGATANQVRLAHREALLGDDNGPMVDLYVS